MRAGAISMNSTPIDAIELGQLLTEAIAVDRRKYHVATKIQRYSEVYARLTWRRRQILHLMLDGRANKWIANELDVSKRTVELDRADILSAFGVANSIELAKIFAEYSTFLDCMATLPPVESRRRSLASFEP